MKKLGIVCALVVLILSPTELQSQVLTGRVLEMESDRPIANASVALVAGDRSILSTESDSLGRFRLPVPGAGWYGVRVERFGYRSTISDSLQVGPREGVDVVIRLDVSAVSLEPLLVVEARRDIGSRSDFERRMEVGLRTGAGVFIDRQALDSTTALTVTGVLARVPLVSMGRNGVPTSLSRGGCTPTLYLNGLRLQGGTSIDELFQPTALEGIEVYRHRSETPAELGGCGAIVFWTRAGEQSRGEGWRFAVAGAALLGLAVLFVAG